MSYSLQSSKLARFTAMQTKHLPFLLEIVTQEHWDVPLTDLELVYREYGEFMTVALNEEGQVLGKLITSREWLFLVVQKIQ